MERQTAWVMLLGAIPWGLLEAGRATFMAVCWTAAAFFLYTKSQRQTTVRTLLLMFVCLTLVYVATLYRPDAVPAVLPAQYVLRVLMDVLIFNAAGAVILVGRRLLPRSPTIA